MLMLIPIRVPFNGSLLPKFMQATKDKVKKILVRASTRSYKLNLVLVWFLKQFMEQVLPVVTTIAKSITEAKLPTWSNKALLHLH